MAPKRTDVRCGHRAEVGHEERTRSRRSRAAGSQDGLRRRRAPRSPGESKLPLLSKINAKPTRNISSTTVPREADCGVQEEGDYHHQRCDLSQSG